MDDRSAACAAGLQTHGAELVDMLVERAALGTPAGRSHLRTLLSLVVERAEKAEEAFVQLVEHICAAPADPGTTAASGAAPAKPLCSVRGLVAAGAMCRHVIVGGTHCGYGGECPHQRVDAPNAELNRLQVVTAGPPLVPQAVIESIQAYGDARADNTPSGPALVACVTAIREALGGRQPEAPAAATAGELSPMEADAERAGFEADAAPYDFDLTRQKTVAPEPWSEYRDEATGHRWGGLAGARRLGPPAQGAAGMNTESPGASKPRMTLDEFFAEAKRLNLRMPLTHEQMCVAFDAKDAKISALAASLQLAEKAIEFAVYLAQGAEQLLDKVNAEDAARQAVEDGDGEPELETALQVASDLRSEHATGVRKDLYEFRRRAVRARMEPLESQPANFDGITARTRTSMPQR